MVVVFVVVFWILGGFGYCFIFVGLCWVVDGDVVMEVVEDGDEWCGGY